MRKKYERAVMEIDLIDTDTDYVFTSSIGGNNGDLGDPFVCAPDGSSGDCLVADTMEVDVL